jgi:ketosteroid isomerase-like protein
MRLPPSRTWTNDAVKADLANDPAFYQNKTNSESISELKVRVQGDLAIATYKSTYDSLMKGQHYARTVLSTDTFRRQNGTWTQVAGHSSQAAK